MFASHKPMLKSITNQRMSSLPCSLTSDLTLACCVETPNRLLIRYILDNGQHNIFDGNCINLLRLGVDFEIVVVPGGKHKI